MQLIELHILQSFPVTCLNRDDVGAPKTAYFGGCQRARVSSQCWKRAIRTQMKEYDSNLFAGARSRFVIDTLRTAFAQKGQSEQAAQLLAEITADALGKLDNLETGTVKTLLYFSPNEINAVAAAMLESDKVTDETLADAALPESSDKQQQKRREDARKALADAAKKASKQLAAKVKDAADIAIFGRMVADDHTLTLEGAGLFSHALSTHKTANEIDFFSAVDDIKDEGSEDAGAGHIGDLEFNSACYYRYVGLNLDLLKDDDHLAHFSPDERKKAVEHFLRAAIFAVPPARKNSMFGFNPPACILALRRSGQPLSLVNAFEQPVASDNGYVDASKAKLEEHWSHLKSTYSLEPDAEKWLPPTNIDDLLNALLSEEV